MLIDLVMAKVVDKPARAPHVPLEEGHQGYVQKLGTKICAYLFLFRPSLFFVSVLRWSTWGALASDLFQPVGVFQVPRGTEP